MTVESGFPKRFVDGLTFNVFDATTHRHACELKDVLIKMQTLWQRVRKTQHAENWNGVANKKKDISTFICKCSLLGLLGMMGRVQNFKRNCVCTTYSDDTQWDGAVSVKKHENSTLKDYIFKQKIINYASLLPLNLIGRAQEKIQMSQAINVLIRDLGVPSILSIQVDALYVCPKKNYKKCKRLLAI